MITQSQMTLLPVGSGSAMNDQVATVVNQAIEDDQGLVYAFGSAYADPGGVSGIHNIHMNKGNPLNSYGQDNGIWRDGALFVYLPSQSQWIAVFIAFRTETWQTDDQGNPASSTSTNASR